MQQRAYKINGCEARASCEGTEMPVEGRPVVKGKERRDKRVGLYFEESVFGCRSLIYAVGTAGL